MAQSLGEAALDIVGLTCDSRQVRPGYLFVALKGTRGDGADFIDDALARGATAVLAEPRAFEHRVVPVPVITDDNPRRQYALMAARFFRAQPRTIAAVTGTNGKTSVVGFVRQMWTRLGRAAAGLGTLGLESPKFRIDASLTTPDAVVLHRALARLADDGVDHLAMEASSHGLDQHRIDGVRLSAAAFTNLTRDHLDYHGTTERYLAAKRRLFDAVMAPGGAAVLNADTPEFDALAEACRARGHRVISYGVADGAEARRDLSLVRIGRTAAGQRLTIRIGGLKRTVDTQLIGDFQAYNLLCALGLVIGCGDGAEEALDVIGDLRGAPRRVERVATLGNGAAVYVDYAHTPDALRALLVALRPYVAGRLSVVFGCGGDRDTGKRAPMGRIACEQADRVIVTDDNPRGEDAALIRAAVLQGCPDAREIGDREAAIVAAMGDLAAGDLLVIAGKGHETGQIVGDETIPFDDAAVARGAAERIGGTES